jgi:Thioredoxin/Copper resistance protein ScsC N-terminal domain
MNDATMSSNRIPLIIALFGAVILLGVGGYLFAKQDNAVERGSVEQKNALANSSADSAVNAAGMKPDERKAVEAIVRAYILENPEIIPEAVEILQKRESSKRLTSVGGRLTTPFPGAEMGNPNGDVTLVEFTDYNCGFCRSSVADVQKLVANDRNVRVIFREVPILSQTSRDAALWALAAAKQGKHKAFHDAMFSGARPDAQSIRAAALKAGMNLGAAEKFAASPEARAEVENNLALMQQIGVSGTPTFVIGDQILEGALGYEALKTAVDRARKQA